MKKHRDANGMSGIGLGLGSKFLLSITNKSIYDIRTAITQLYKIHESVDRIGRISDRDKTRLDALS